MYNLWLVGSGGFLGSVARYYSAGGRSEYPRQPLPLRNASGQCNGCFLIGSWRVGAEHAHWMKASTACFC
jgi:fluoride ion exporter CrcB/FEX